MQDFHPSSFKNQKKVWVAQQKAKAADNREKERLQEMQQEQAMHETKRFALMTRKESEKAMERHSVNFMYDAPPGVVAKVQETEGEGLKLELDQGHADKVLSMEEKFKFLKGAPPRSWLAVRFGDTLGTVWDGAAQCEMPAVPGVGPPASRPGVPVVWRAGSGRRGGSGPRGV